MVAICRFVASEGEQRGENVNDSASVRAMCSRIAEFIADNLQIRGNRAKVCQELNIDYAKLRRYETPGGQGNASRDFQQTMEIIEALGYDYRLVLVAAYGSADLPIMKANLCTTRGVGFDLAWRHLMEVADIHDARVVRLPKSDDPGAAPRLTVVA